MIFQNMPTRDSKRKGLSKVGESACKKISFAKLSR